MDPIEKFLLSILVLGTMSVIVVTFYKNKEDIDNSNEKKMVDEFQNIMENFTTKDEDEDEKEYEPYEPQKEGFQASVIEGLDIGKEIIKGLTKPFKPVIDFFNAVKKFADTLPGRLRSFASAFKNLGYGLKAFFTSTAKSLELGVPDIFNVIGSAGKCAVKRVVNFKSCVIWYMLEIIGNTLYSIFVGLPIFAFKFCTGIDLQPYVDIVFCYLEELDKLVFKNYCFHFMHFPEEVIERCYECDYQRHIDKLNKDFNLNKVGEYPDRDYPDPPPNGTIPHYMNKPKKNFADAKRDFKKFLFPRG
jgi:hypothetical protein